MREPSLSAVGEGFTEKLDWVRTGKGKCCLQGKLTEPGQSGELLFGTVGNQVSREVVNQPVAGFKYQANKNGLHCMEARGSR